MENFSVEFDCRTVSLGKPQSFLIQRLQERLSPSVLKGPSAAFAATEDTSFLRAMRALFSALLRYQVAVKARRLARRGSLVFADRWPTTKLVKWTVSRLPCPLEDLKR